MFSNLGTSSIDQKAFTLPTVQVLECATSARMSRRALCNLKGHVIGIGIKPSSTVAIGTWRSHCKGSSFSGHPLEHGELFHKHTACLIQDIVALDATTVLVGRALSVVGSFAETTRAMLSGTGGRRMVKECLHLHRSLLDSNKATFREDSVLCHEEGWIAVALPEITGLTVFPGAYLTKKGELQHLFRELEVVREDAEERAARERERFYKNALKVSVQALVVGGALGVGGMALMSSSSKPESKPGTAPDGRSKPLPPRSKADAKADSENGGGAAAIGRVHQSKMEIDTEPRPPETQAMPSDETIPSASTQLEGNGKPEQGSLSTANANAAREQSSVPAKEGTFVELERSLQILRQFVDFYGDSPAPIDVRSKESRAKTIRSYREAIENLRPTSAVQGKLLEALAALSGSESDIETTRKFEGVIEAVLLEVPGFEPRTAESPAEKWESREVGGMFRDELQPVAEVLKKRGIAVAGIESDSSAKMHATIKSFLEAVGTPAKKDPGFLILQLALQGLRDHGATPQTLQRFSATMDLILPELESPDTGEKVESRAKPDGAGGEKREAEKSLAQTEREKLLTALQGVSDVLMAFGDSPPEIDLGTMGKTHEAIVHFRGALDKLSPKVEEQKALLALTEHLISAGLTTQAIDDFMVGVARIKSGSKELNPPQQDHTNKERLKPHEIQAAFQTEMQRIGSVLIKRGIAEPPCKVGNSQEMHETLQAYMAAFGKPGLVYGQKINDCLHVMLKRGVTQASLGEYRRALDECRRQAPEIGYEIYSGAVLRVRIQQATKNLEESDKRKGDVGVGESQKDPAAKRDEGVKQKVSPELVKAAEHSRQVALDAFRVIPRSVKSPDSLKAFDPSNPKEIMMELEMVFFALYHPNTPRPRGPYSSQISKEIEIWRDLAEKQKEMGMSRNK